MTANNIITPRRREDFFDQSGEPTLRFIRWIELVTQQTNLTSNDIESNSIADNYTWQVGEEEKKVTAVTKSTDYTARPFDFVNAKSGAAIAFPANPKEDDFIVIRNGDGTKITLSGNGKNMNGSATGELTTEGTAIEFYYFIASDEWFAR